MAPGLPGHAAQPTSLSRVRRLELDSSKSQVIFAGSSSIHPLVSKTSDLTGYLEINRDTLAHGELVVNAATLKSSNPLVDRETRRRLNTKRYPHISGTLTSAKKSGQVYQCTGEVNLIGQSIDVEGTLEMRQTEDGVQIQGSATFDIRQWGFEPPKILTLKVHPNVDVTVDLFFR